MCKKLEATPSGNIHNKRNGNTYYSVSELLANQGCNNCTEKFNCKLIDILERKEPQRF